MKICETLSKIKDYLLHNNKKENTKTDLIEKILIDLNKEYEQYENTIRPEGYQVIFKTKPQLNAKLFPIGEQRTTTQLSGVPENQDAYKAGNCSFCTSALKVEQIFSDRCRAILSRSNQVLVIPDTHYAHWFDMPLEVQATLLRHGLELRKLHPQLQEPLELHCGSAGAQTVFHTHLRTGIIRTE